VLLRYRVMAYLVGTLLIILVLVGVPLRYLAVDGSTAQQAGDWITMYLGILHGWLYMLFLVAAAMLARQARFPLGFTVLVLLLGTVPVASFLAERLATRRTRVTLAESATDASPVSRGGGGVSRRQH